MNQFVVDAEVFASHAVSGEVQLKMTPAIAAVDPTDFPDGLHGLFHSTNEKTALAVENYFRHGAGRASDHWRSTSQGFDRHQAKRFGPLNRKEESRRISEEFLLFRSADFPDEIDQRMIE